MLEPSRIQNPICRFPSRQPNPLKLFGHSRPEYTLPPYLEASCVLQAQALVQAAVRFIQEVGGEADAAEGGIPEAVELRKQLQEVEELRRDVGELASSSGILALRRALSALELLLFYTVKTEVAGKCAAVMYLTSRRQHVILARIGEVLWLARDAVELARDVQEHWFRCYIATSHDIKKAAKLQAVRIRASLRRILGWKPQL